jgi:ankyrin repeat protein
MSLCRNCTPAHYAASGTDFQVLEMLLKKTNVVNETDSTGKTPLFYAIYNSSEEQVNILRILIENGAKLNEKDILGKTALHYAAEMGKTRCIPFLLQRGANLDIVDNRNKTALDLAPSEKVKNIMLAYTQSKGVVSESEVKEKRM